MTSFALRIAIASLLPRNAAWICFEVEGQDTLELREPALVRFSRRSTALQVNSTNAQHIGHTVRDGLGTDSNPASEGFIDTDRYSLYLDFAPLVKRLIRQYGKTVDQRQDLEGEIYCQFCAHLDAYDPHRGVPLRPYIVRLLSASVFTHVRKQWKLEERETAMDQSDDSHPAFAVDPTPTWMHNVSQQQVIASLPLSLSQLPDRQRKVVILRYYEQRSFEEIGEFLEIKPATARSLLRHGLTSLRKHISPMHCEDL